MTKLTTKEKFAVILMIGILITIIEIADSVWELVIWIILGIILELILDAVEY